VSLMQLIGAAVCLLSATGRRDDYFADAGNGWRYDISTQN